MTTSIDWQALAQRLDKLKQDRASTDSDSTKRDIEGLLGEEHLQSAVDYCITDKLGSRVARSVLQQLRPWPAMERCYELFHEGSSDTRRSVVELLSVIADGRVLPWVSEFLDDEDPLIQYLGAEILDQLVWSGAVTCQECTDVLAKMREHSNVGIRVMASLICSPPPNKAYAY